VELRNHPQMRWRGRRNWPPHWKGAHTSDRPLPKGEVGVLVRVEIGSGDVKTPHCFLDIRWNNQEYFGVLFFDDQEFSKVLYDTVHRYIGWPISEIGSLDIS
jgi:hypothetical protein